MRVIIFPYTHLYQVRSNQIYVDNLIAALQTNAVDIKVEKFADPQGQNKYWQHWVLYPYSVRKAQADVYHVSDHSLAQLLFALPLEKTVVTCHDLIPLLFPQHVSFWKRFLLWPILFMRIRQCAAIIVPSQRTKKDVIQLMKVPREKIHVVYHGIPKVFRPLEKTSLPQRFLDLHDAVLHVGHSGFYKNLDCLIKALALSKRKITLVKVGPLPLKYKTMLNKNKIPFLHFECVSLEELAMIYNAVGVLAFPSLYEGFGFPVLEAMACGCPVICSTAGSLPEIASGAALEIQADDYVSLSKNIDQLLADEVLRSTVISKGLTQAMQFSLEKSVEQTAKVYRMVAAGQ